MTVGAVAKKQSNFSRILTGIWDEFVYGGHLLSFGLVGVVLTSSFLLRINVTWDFLVIIYLFTLSACLFGRYLGLQQDMVTNPERSEYLGKSYKQLPYRIVTQIIIGLSILMYFRKYQILVLCVAMLIMSFLYDYSIKKYTKRIIGLKNFFIAAIFSLVASLAIPYYSVSIPLQAFVLMEVFVFLMLVIGTSFSDIKDIESDRIDRLKTFAVVFGAKKLVSILCVINIIAGVPIAYGVVAGVFPLFSITLILAIFYNFIYLYESRKVEPDFGFLTNVILDSQFILWPGFVLIGKVFSL